MGEVILASSGPNEVSFEDESLKQGVFTYYLLRALKGAADYDRDGLITADEVYSYTKKKVPKATRQSHTPYKLGESDVIHGRAQ